FLRDRYRVVREITLDLAHDLAHQGGALLRRGCLREVRRRADDFGRRTDSKAACGNVSGDERVGSDDGSVTYGRSRHYEHSPGKPHALAQRDRLVGDPVAVQGVGPGSVGANEAMGPAAGAIAADDGLGRIDRAEVA